MKPIMGLYQFEEDYWRIREFLRDVSISMLEMLDVAEQKLPKIKDDSKKELTAWVNAADDSTKNFHRMWICSNNRIYF